MDFDGLARVLARIHQGDIRLMSRDTAEPSPLAHEIINARPYAFLDDAPLEERRTQAVQARRASQPASADDLGRLDAAAIERVRDEARPDPRDADELHDALLGAGFLTAADLAGDAEALDALFERLVDTGRAAIDHDHRRPQSSSQSAPTSNLQPLASGCGSPPSDFPRFWPSTRARPSTAALFLRPRARPAHGHAKTRSSRSCAAGWRLPGRRRPHRSPRRAGSTELDANAALLALESRGSYGDFRGFSSTVRG